MANVTWNVARCQVPIILGTGTQEHFYPRLVKTFSKYRTTFPFHTLGSNQPRNLVSMASCNANVPERASDFHRTVLGDFFINHSPEPLQASIFTAWHLEILMFSCACLGDASIKIWNYMSDFRFPML